MTSSGQPPSDDLTARRGDWGLAAHLVGPLDEIEDAVRATERAPSIEAVTADLRTDVALPGVIRWLRRRIAYAHEALGVARGLSPTSLADTGSSLEDIADALGVEGGVLVRLRAELDPHLQAVASPVGFRRRRGRTTRSRDGPNNRWGRRQRTHAP